jgi:hypothetical protein
MLHCPDCGAECEMTPLPDSDLMAGLPVTTCCRVPLWVTPAPSARIKAGEDESRTDAYEREQRLLGRNPE